MFNAPNTIGIRSCCATERDSAGLVRDPATEDRIVFTKDVGTGADDVGRFKEPNPDPRRDGVDREPKTC